MSAMIERMVSYGRSLLARSCKSPEDPRVKSALFSSLQREFPGAPPEDYRKALTEIVPHVEPADREEEEEEEEAIAIRPPNKVDSKFLPGLAEREEINSYSEPLYGFVGKRFFRKTQKSLHEVDCIMTPESERELLDEWDRLTGVKRKLSLRVKELEIESKKLSLEIDTFEYCPRHAYLREKREMSFKLNTLDAQLHEKRLELATCQGRIDEIEQEHRTGSVTRFVECTECFDLEEGVLCIERRDTCDVIARRLMTEEEKAQFHQAGSRKQRPTDEPDDDEPDDDDEDLDERSEPEAAPVVKFEAPKPPKLAEPTLPSWAVGVPKLNVPDPEAEPEPEAETEPSPEPEAQPEPQPQPEPEPEPESEPELEAEPAGTQSEPPPAIEAAKDSAKARTIWGSTVVRPGEPTTPGAIGVSGMKLATVSGASYDAVHRYLRGLPVRRHVALQIETALKEKRDEIQPDQKPKGFAAVSPCITWDGEATTAGALGHSSRVIAAAVGTSDGTVRRFFRKLPVGEKTGRAIMAYLKGEAPEEPKEPSREEKIAALEKQLEELKAAPK